MGDNLDIFNNELEANDIISDDEDVAEGIDDLSGISLNDVQNVVTSAADWTVETIVSQIKKGHIDLKPKYQRRRAWTPKKQSIFIESLIFNFPIPQLVLAESLTTRGYYIVIDGKQRLLSIMDFLATQGDSDFIQLKLNGLTLDKELNGSTKTDIENSPLLSKYYTSFENATIRTTVIRGWKDERFLYQVFLRLNRQTATLSPQELRQALHPGAFIDFAVEESGRNTHLRRILKISDKDGDFRMRDVELFIRYYSFKMFLSSYKGNLKDFLDTTCESLNDNWESRKTEVNGLLSDFSKACEITNSIFKENEFRKYKNDKYEGRFNRAVFDIMMMAFSDSSTWDKISGHEKEYEDAFKKLCSDEAFLSSIESTTKSLTATQTRIDKWLGEVNRIAETKLQIPKLTS